MIQHHSKWKGVFLSLCLFSISDITLAGLGSYLNGAGSNNRALSGAGTAFAEDGMVMAVNPAGLVTLDYDGWQFGSLFLTARQTAKATAVDPAEAPAGAFSLPTQTQEADPDVPAEIDDIFPIPFAAIHRRLNQRNAIGLVVYGNGGINVNYKAFDNPNCPPDTPGRGYLCFGDTGSNIAQVFIAPVWSHKVNSRLRIGVSPELIYQTLEVNGFQLFVPASARPNRVSNNGHAQSLGYGVKFGASVDLNERLSLGLSLQSRGRMQNFGEYSGLLAEQGDFDVAPFFQVGLAWKLSDKLTLLADFQRIYFSKIKAISNPSDAPGRYGDENGPGFGWDDLSAIKVGLHYRHGERLTLRLGATDVLREPVGQEDVLSNLVSNAVFDQRINAGISWTLHSGSALDLAVNIVPKQDISGPNPLSRGQRVTLSNELYSVDIGWRKSF